MAANEPGQYDPHEQFSHFMAPAVLDKWEGHGLGGAQVSSQ
jgi:hypothetical protein